MGNLIAQLAPYSKAIRGTMVAILGGVLVALTNGDGITAQEWVMIALAALGVGEGVYSTWNATPGGTPMPGGSLAHPDEPPPAVFSPGGTAPTGYVERWPDAATPAPEYGTGRASVPS